MLNAHDILKDPNCAVVSDLLETDYASGLEYEVVLHEE